MSRSADEKAQTLTGSHIGNRADTNFTQSWHRECLECYGAGTWISQGHGQSRSQVFRPLSDTTGIVNNFEVLAFDIKLVNVRFRRIGDKIHNDRSGSLTQFL